MIPIKSMDLNRFQFVKIPKVRDLFFRSGGVDLPPQTSDDDESILSVRKNDVVREVEELADKVPVNDPDHSDF